MIKGIQNFYKEISVSYELINSLLTLGLDSRWRKKTVKLALNGNSNAGFFLDICSGTGQTAALISKYLSPGKNSRIYAADFSHPMLKKAKERCIKENIDNIDFTLADTVKLPFKDNTFDIITITFATRNLAAAPGHLLKSFQEFNRVLKPGGVFFNLETSQPAIGIIKKLFHLYVKLTVAPLGRMISGSRGSYAYLSQSIRKFLPADELTDALYDAGFTKVSRKKYLFGAVALHQARK